MFLRSVQKFVGRTADHRTICVHEHDHGSWSTAPTEKLTETTMKNARNLILAVAAFLATPASAQYTDGTIKIGVLTDMSSLFSDIGGPGSVIAAKLAVEDFGAAAKGMRIEIVGADMQNKPDVGASIANSWFDVEKVDVIVNGMNAEGGKKGPVKAGPGP